MKRIFTFDIIRAVAIIGVVYVHTLMHTWTSTAAVEGGTEEPGFLVLFMFYLLTMAGLFYVVMGAVNAYMMYHRLESKRNTKRQMLLSSVVMGVFLIGSHYIFRVLFSADSGILYFFVREGEFIEPAAKWIIGTSTLAMLGWISILVPLILAGLFHGNGINKMRRNYWILGISATVLILATPVIRDSLVGYVVDWIADGNYLPAIALGAFVYDLFPIFPYLGYGLYGAIIGLALTKEKNHSRLMRFLLVLGIFWMAVGWVGNIYYGGPDPTLYRDVTHQAIFNKTFLQVSQLGLFMIFVLIGLIIFDMLPVERRKKRQKRFEILRKFSLVSLTIYLIEGFVWAIFIVILDQIPGMGGWKNSMGIVLLAGLFHLLIWTLIVHLWDKVGYKGSIEWLVLKFIETISGKRSEKFNIKRDAIIKEVPDVVRKERPGYIIPKKK
jgi:surface polysaccharide O-acyltransferase-like enzyme